MRLSGVAVLAVHTIACSRRVLPLEFGVLDSEGGDLNTASEHGVTYFRERGAPLRHIYPRSLSGSGRTELEPWSCFLTSSRHSRARCCTRWSETSLQGESTGNTFRSFNGRPQTGSARVGLRYHPLAMFNSARGSRISLFRTLPRLVSRGLVPYDCK